MNNTIKISKTPIIIFCIFTTACVSHESTSVDSVNVVCSSKNDLYQLLVQNNYPCKRYDDVNEAMDKCSENGILLVLGTAYPKTKTILPKDFYLNTKAKNLKVYVEFPDRLSTEKTGQIKSTKKERLIANSGFFGEALPPMSILDAGLYSYVEVPDRECHLKGANVAGFHTAVYGLENTQNVPILFEEGCVLVSTTKLSNFRKSRYSPTMAWHQAIKSILGYLSIDETSKFKNWEPIVKPKYTKDEKLSEDAYKIAVEQGKEWYVEGRFLIHQDWETHWRSVDTLLLPVGPPMDLNLPSGDGALGVMEGHFSYIKPDGSQPYRYWLRADCVAETAMTLAAANGVKRNSKYLKTAVNLMDFLFISETFKTANSKDLNQSSYGLIGWADTHKDRYYGDDNARVILGSVLAAQTLENPKWNKQILELILANYRTSGKKGFRSNALMGAYIDQTTWQILLERDLENIAPHYESWLWATYIWLYDKTKYQPLLDKAKSAIRITMENYPNSWLWANGLQQERARMILPLSWLVRVEDSEQNRQWLNRVCDDLLIYQVECGALREELGEGSQGKYGAPKNNQHYGTTEAPVIHTNGEPVADMLYTCNFAFFALNEAAQATNNPKYLLAVDKLGDFLVRIQSSSSGRADLDGCWFRAFDYENWEYYGSNADHGWGAWGTLTGWTQSFITTTLALKMQETSYWELTRETTIGDDFDESLKIMLPTDLDK